MTGLLVSVASVDEAVAALDGGVDLIDLKAPTRGTLGAWPLPAIKRAAGAVAGRRPLSATIGDGVSDICRLVARTAATADFGVNFVKVGFFPGGNHCALAEALAREAVRGTQIVAVLFADCDADLALFDRFAAIGFAGVMLDTADKHNVSLRRCFDDVRLGHFVEEAHSRRLLVGLAGSLSGADVAPLLSLNPDYLGFRGAVCEGGRRENRLDPARLAAIRTSIPSIAAATITAQPRATPPPPPARSALPTP